MLYSSDGNQQNVLAPELTGARGGREKKNTV